MKRREYSIIIAIAIGAVVFAGVLAYLEREDTTGIDTPAWWLERTIKEHQSAPKDAWYYDDIVRAYARAGDIEQAVAVVEKITSARQPSRITRALNSVRNLLSNMGIGSPRGTIRMMVPGKAGCLSVIATVQAEQGDIEGAKATADYIGTGQRNPDSPEYRLARTYAAIAKAQARKGDFDGAMETAKRLRDDYRPSAANLRTELIATLHAMKGDAPAARATIGAIQRPSYWTLADIAAIFAKRGDKENYQTFIRFAEESFLGLPGVPNQNLFRMLSQIQAMAGDLEGARATIQRIVDVEERLAVSTDLGWCFKHMNDVKDMELSRMYYRLAADVAEQVEITPRTAASIAHAYAGIGDIAAAMAAAEGVADAQQESYASQCIALALAEASDFEGAKAYFQKITVKDRKLLFCRQFAKYLGMAGQRLELLKWIKTLPTPAERGRAYLGAAEGIIEKNNEAKNSDANAKEEGSR